jgi:hypothetical protein
MPPGCFYFGFFRLFDGDGVCDGATGTLGSALLEAVAELPVDGLEVPHAAGAGGLSPLGLLGPVVCLLLVFLFLSLLCPSYHDELVAAERSRRRTLPGLSGGVGTAGASVLLDVERAAATATAHSVRLVL